MVIIDGHSHFGNDYFHGNTDLNDYIVFIESEGITCGLVMPIAVPVDDHNNRFLIWEINKNQICYSSDVYSEIKNPYRRVNEQYYQNVIDKKCKRLFYIPLVHPILDDIEYLERIILPMDPVALKIHGVGSGIDPNVIPETFSKFVKDHDLMLILHTDYDDGKNEVRYDTLLLRELNTPLRWAKYLKNNKIHGVLNHGAAIDKETWALVNDSKYLKIAIGPDAIVQADSGRVYPTKEELDDKGYLQMLKAHVHPEKLIFDIDYNWNIDPQTGDIDYSSIERIKNIWPLQEQELIFGQNILDHCSRLKEKFIQRFEEYTY